MFSAKYVEELLIEEIKAELDKTIDEALDKLLAEHRAELKTLVYNKVLVKLRSSFCVHENATEVNIKLKVKDKI